MSTPPITLQAWDTLTEAQRSQVAAIRIEAAQHEFSGSIEGAIASCSAQPGPDVCGVAIVQAGLPVGFMVLKRGTAGPDWLPPAAAVISGLQLDISVQGQGLGPQALRALPAWLLARWPTLERIVLRVDDHNRAGIRAYEKAGWQEYGARLQGRVGLERSMNRWLQTEPATGQTA